jgi:hypothetical protein
MIRGVLDGSISESNHLPYPLESHRFALSLRIIFGTWEHQMTSFNTSSQTTGSSDDVLRTAIVTLTSNGFAISHRNSKSVSLKGPGLNNTRQNPILGASKISLQIHDNSIVADAELGGVDAMERFLMRFPFLLGLGMGLFFGVAGGLLFGRQFGVGFGVPWAQGWRWMLLAFGGAMLPVAPWLILSPLMSRMIRRRTQNAVETLIHNAAFATQPAL